MGSTTTKRRGRELVDDEDVFGEQEGEESLSEQSNHNVSQKR